MRYSQIALVFIAVCGLAFVPACGGGDCETPPDFGYDCEPQTDTANACVGGPMINGVQHDADKNFPISCHAGARTCVDGDERIAQQCECLSGFAGVTWACS
jgi:hypothetical protein